MVGAFIVLEPGATFDPGLDRVFVISGQEDGADLPAALRVESQAELHAHAGETFDFTWTPEEVGDLVLSIRYPRFLEHGEVTLRQTWRVR